MGIEIERIETREANAILEGDGGHYLGRATFRPQYCLTTPARDELAVFSSPIAAHFTRVLDHPLELARLWKRDIPPDDKTDRDVLRILWGKPGQLAKFLIGSLKWLREQAPDVDCVTSYADPNARDSRVRPGRTKGRRHNGDIYEVCKFAYLGPSTRGADKWRTETGEIINEHVLYRDLGTRSRVKIAALKPDWKRIKGGPPKHLYVYKMRLTVPEVLARLGPGSRYKKVLPYPRPCD
jgi:hypothetical protein